jgi:hypothetical protein
MQLLRGAAREGGADQAPAFYVARLLELQGDLDVLPPPPPHLSLSFSLSLSLPLLHTALLPLEPLVHTSQVARLVLLDVVWRLSPSALFAQEGAPGALGAGGGVTEDMGKPWQGNVSANRLKAESFVRLAMLQKKNVPPAASDRERTDAVARLLQYALNIDAAQARPARAPPAPPPLP